MVANLRTFCVLFQAYILWWCAKIDKYEVYILLAQVRHNRWQRHPQVKRVQSQDANLPAAVGRAAMRAAHVSLPTHWCLSLLSRPKPSYLSSKYRQMCTSQTQSHRQEHTHASPNTNTHKHRFRSYIVSEQNVINDFVLIFLFFCMFKLKTFSGRCPKSSLFQYTSHWFGQSIQMSALTVHLSPLECRESLMHHLNRRYCSAEGPCVSESLCQWFNRGKLSFGALLTLV